MTLLHRLLHVVIAAGALASLASMSAAAQSAGPSLVVDAATGAVLHEERATQAWHPASTTKMMTAYVALRAVRAGRIGLETPIPASALAAKQPRVKVYIKAGQEIILDSALKIMMVKSANDISYVIAEGVGGNVETFVGMMNAEARRLGMRDTVFRNPNGWHDPEQQTSARDLAILTMTMLREFPEYADYWGIGAVQIGRTTLNNTNGLIGRYAGANGFKTGFVCASGFNVVATATRGGRTLIAVVLGSYSGAERTLKAAQILDASFASWGGTGVNVQNMPASGTQARSICAEVRAFGRGAPLADDADSFGPISVQQNAASENGGASLYAAFTPAQASTARTSGGRLTLGPRQQFVPLQLAYGRSAGSDRAPIAANVAARRGTSVAASGAAAPSATAVTAARELASVPPLAPGQRPRTVSANGSIQPGTTTGAAPLIPGVAVSGAAAGGAVAGAAAAFAARQSSSAATDSPIRLHGAIGQGGGRLAPPDTRPSAGAGIRPKPVATPSPPKAAALTSPSRSPAATAQRPAAANPSSAPARPQSASARPAPAKPLAKPAPARPATAPAKPPRRDQQRND